MNSYSDADNVIAKLQSSGFDYTPHRDEIEHFFDTYLYEGNWEGVLEFDNGMPSLRFIQEDEYDQHYSDAFKTSNEKMYYASSHYIWIIK